MKKNTQLGASPLFHLKMHKFTFIWLAALLTGCDQASKRLVEKSLNLHESIPVISNFFSITHNQNTGAAFGFLANLEIGRIVLTALSLSCVLFLIYVLFSFRAGESRYKYWGMTFILGGALGNLFDRAASGTVTDWIDFHLAKHASFPTFNLADVFITFGVAILLLASWLMSPPKNSMEFRRPLI
jgi:signal peptidase II